MQMLSPETAMTLMQHSEIKSPANMQTKDMKRMQEVAREFEAVFVSEMMKPMFEGIETDEMFGGGKGEEVFRGMMIQEYGKTVSHKDVTGIQTQVLHKLIEMQAEQTAQSQTAAIQRNAVIDAEFTETLGNQEGNVSP